MLPSRTAWANMRCITGRQWEDQLDIINHSPVPRPKTREKVIDTKSCVYSWFCCWLLHFFNRSAAKIKWWAAFCRRCYNVWKQSKHWVILSRWPWTAIQSRTPGSAAWWHRLGRIGWGLEHEVGRIYKDNIWCLGGGLLFTQHDPQVWVGSVHVGRARLRLLQRAGQTRCSKTQERNVNI